MYPFYRTQILATVKFLLFPILLILATINTPVFAVSAEIADTSFKDTAGIGYCPIRPDQPVSHEIFADYNRRRFFFCCESCRQDFLSDPSRFDGLEIASAQTLSSAGVLKEYRGDEEDIDGGLFAWLGNLALTLDEWNKLIPWDDSRLRYSLCGLLAIVALSLSYRYRRAILQKVFVDGLSLREVKVIFLLSTGTLLYYIHALHSQMDETTRQLDVAKEKIDNQALIDSIHYGTFFTSGKPPRPRKSTLPPGFSKTYYRGNDERTAEMFNGGNYRTVTFTLRVEDQAGKEVLPGDDLFADSIQLPLRVHIEFARSPDTSSGYFTEEYMKRMYVTSSSDPFMGRTTPLKDRVSWTMIEPEQKWATSYPLSGQTVKKDDQLKGIVYLCEERFQDEKIIGGRFHFAIEYKINVKAGIIQEGSDLWMGAIYRGRNFANLQVTDEEWLSTKPIPEKPK